MLILRSFSKRALIVVLFCSVVLVGVYAYTLNNQTSVLHSSVPVPKYRVDLDLNSAEGFDEVISRAPPSGFPKLVIRQGGVGKVKITLKRLYTEETLWIALSLYGIAPDFDKWILGLVENKALPEGITYSINPSLVKLSTDEVYSSTLTIAVGPDAQTGSFKLTVEAYLIYTSGGQSGSCTGQSFSLEVKPRDQ